MLMVQDKERSGSIRDKSHKDLGGRLGLKERKRSFEMLERWVESGVNWSFHPLG